MAKDLFKLLREKHGANLNTFISERTTIIPGDITIENLGVKDTNLLEEMWREVDVVVNLAATTNFDERYIYIYIRTLIISEISKIRCKTCLVTYI